MVFQGPRPAEPAHVDGDHEEARRERAREHRKVLLFAVPIVFLFAITDSMLLGGAAFARAFAVRLLWAGALGATGWALPRVSTALQRGLLLVVSISSAVFFALIVRLTGGFASPMFHFLVAMPVVIAVLVQDPEPTVGGGVATLIAGLALVLGAGQPVAFAIEWTVQAAGMCALAAYASLTYRRLRLRALGSRRDHAHAAERARTYEEAVRARDELLSVASHELRTPLTSLQLQLESLLRSGAAAEEGGLSLRSTTKLEAIGRQVRRLATLIETLLDVSRLVAGRLSLSLADTDLAQLARDTVARFADDAARVESVVSVRGDARVDGRWDPLRIEQVLTNLVSNAIKYGAGRPVEVVVSGEAERVQVTVRDQGIGIAPADHQRVFQRFERAVTDPHIGGLGLGLWITRHLVEGMSGRILLVSEPGRGSTFTVELPRRLDAASLLPPAGRIAG